MSKTYSKQLKSAEQHGAYIALLRYGTGYVFNPNRRIIRSAFNGIGYTTINDVLDQLLSSDLALKVKPTSKLAATLSAVSRDKKVSEENRAKIEQLIQLDPSQCDATIRKLLQRYSAPWYVRLFTGDLLNKHVRQVRGLLRKFTDTKELITNCEMLTPSTKDPLCQLISHFKIVYSRKTAIVNVHIEDIISTIKIDKIKLPIFSIYTTFLSDVLTNDTSQSEFSQQDVQSEESDSDTALTPEPTPRVHKTSSATKSKSDKPNDKHHFTENYSVKPILTEEQAQAREQRLQKMRDAEQQARETNRELKAEIKRQQQARMRTNYINSEKRRNKTAELMATQESQQTLIDARMSTHKTKRVLYEVHDFIVRIKQLGGMLNLQIRGRSVDTNNFDQVFTELMNEISLNLTNLENFNLQQELELLKRLEQGRDFLKTLFVKVEQDLRLEVESLVNKIFVEAPQILSHLKSPWVFNYTKEQTDDLTAQCEASIDNVIALAATPNDNIAELQEKKAQLEKRYQVLQDIGLEKLDAEVKEFYNEIEDVKSGIALTKVLIDLMPLDPSLQQSDIDAIAQTFQQNFSNALPVLNALQHTDKTDFETFASIDKGLTDFSEKHIKSNKHSKLSDLLDILASLGMRIKLPIIQRPLIACLFEQPLNINKIQIQLCGYAQQAQCLFDDLDELVNGSIFLPPTAKSQSITTRLNHISNNPALDMQNTAPNFVQALLFHGIFGSPTNAPPNQSSSPEKQRLHSVMLDALVDRVNDNLDLGEVLTTDQELLELLQSDNMGIDKTKTLDSLLENLRNRRLDDELAGPPIFMKN